MATSNKDVAFGLFDKGKTPLSAEVKALKLKGSTRWNYYLEWKRKRGYSDESPPPSTGPKGRVASEMQMIAEPSNIEGEESLGEVNEEEDGGEPDESEEKGASEAKRSGDGKKPPPRMIAGQGLTFSITISTKTLMLYQIAAASQEGELTLGDFIDTCVEDTYHGRGLDLGLVKIGGENG